MGKNNLGFVREETLIEDIVKKRKNYCTLFFFLLHLEYSRGHADCAMELEIVSA